MNSSANSAATSSGDARTEGCRRRSSRSRSACAASSSIGPSYHMSFEFRIGHETGILAASSAYLNCLDYLPRNACERRAMLEGDGKEVGLLSGSTAGRTSWWLAHLFNYLICACQE